MKNTNEGSVTINLQSYDELKAIQREFEDRLKKNRDEIYKEIHYEFYGPMLGCDLYNVQANQPSYMELAVKLNEATLNIWRLERELKSEREDKTMIKERYEKAVETHKNVFEYLNEEVRSAVHSTRVYSISVGVVALAIGIFLGCILQ